MRPTTQKPLHHFAAHLLHQPNSQSTPVKRINAAPNLWPGQQQQFQATQFNQQQFLFPQQQQPQSMTQPNRNPPRDSQGHALVLSPEHCKMVSNNILFLLGLEQTKISTIKFLFKCKFLQ